MRTELEQHDIETVIKETVGKYDKGRIKYGHINLAKDTRDFIYEAEQELLDCINYCVFQIIRLRQISGTIQAQGYKKT